MISEGYNTIIRRANGDQAVGDKEMTTLRRGLGKEVSTGRRWKRLLRWNASATALFPELIEVKNANNTIDEMRDAAFNEVLALLSEVQGR